MKANFFSVYLFTTAAPFSSFEREKVCSDRLIYPSRLFATKGRGLGFGSAL